MKRIDKELAIRSKRIWNGIKIFFKKFGIWAVVALVIWLSPSWLSFFIPALKPFALTWLGLVVSPMVPSWAAVPLLAVVTRLIYAGIIWLINKIKEWITKFAIGFKMVTYYYLDEIELFLKKGQEMKEIKDKAKNEFNEKIRSERIKLITEHWEPTLEEAETKTKEN